MKALRIEASTSRRKSDSQQGLRMQAGCTLYCESQMQNRIGGATDKDCLKPTTVNLEEVCPCHS
jgi:hypothetical protein